MQNKKILIIDDDAQLRRLMEYPLSKEGANVVLATNGKDGLRQLYSEKPDLVILDVMMPEMDGWETCKNIRQLSDVPIMMVTARGKEDDIIRGLDLGADDYITKPFQVKVLVARVRATLRRANLKPERESKVSYSDDYLTVDIEAHRIFAAGEPVKLTATEFRLLAYLLENAGRVMSFNQILENVWGWDYVGDDNYIRVYIWHLRKKIEKDSKNPEYIQNIQGIGYRFEKKG
ncbi:MAG: response regulator transcription factor [Chloroflexi bacterium]|nr:response regulator transcription factor [Chloroflexota bacterium]